MPSRPLLFFYLQQLSLSQLLSLSPGHLQRVNYSFTSLDFLWYQTILVADRQTDREVKGKNKIRI